MTFSDAAKAPWRFGELPTSSWAQGQPNVLASRVSTVPIPLLPIIKAEGLEPAAVDGLRRLLVLSQSWIGKVPDLERLVQATVRDIHPVASEPGYDVSHSQPVWRSRIFVSCPEREDSAGALRLAESVIHEAMHLHLTNEEEREPYVARPSASAYSPWRGVERPVQGVMHGLFVFLCIFRFLKELRTGSRLVGEARHYVESRLRTIEEEIAYVDTGLLSRFLTPRGREAVIFWMAGRDCTFLKGDLSDKIVSRRVV